MPIKDCSSWNPISVGPTQLYSYDVELPSFEELDAMSPKERNAWREKAEKKFYYQMRKLWQADCVDTEEKIREVVAFYRWLREKVFGKIKYGCYYTGYKKWEYRIDWMATWETYKPDWYTC